MKKLLAVVLAAVLALSLGVISFAADPDLTVKLYLKDDGTVLPVSDYVIDGAKNNTNEIEPDSDIFFKLPSGLVKITAEDGTEYTFDITADDLTDKDLYKVSYDKGDDNTKMITKMALSEDKKGDPETRGPWLKVSVKQVYDDTEYKIAPAVTFTTKKDIISNEDDEVALAKGYKIKFEVGKFYINNDVLEGDQDFSAGTNGVVVKPAKNDDNEVTWEDENNTIATLKFMGDDNQTKFFPKLSTKWEDADYADYFADQDAFIFNFTGKSAGKTRIASTSRATLELYNPYYDSDEDELTVEPENCVVYMVGDDGSINDVTASFKAIENDDGDYVFQTKTRELGVYIIAEKPYTTAAAEDVETPDDGKAIPDTGIWA